jgi:two-component system NarL family response regulator
MNEFEQASHVITVLVVDDHPLLRDGIASALENEPDMRLVAEAVDGKSALEQFRIHQPDVTLMDLQMPGMSGIEALRAIRGEFPIARVIVLTTYSGDAQVLNALKSGASGFMLKGMMRKELRETIRAVHAGGRVIPPEVAVELATHAGSGVLSAREIEVLRWVARGLGNKEIAAELHISEDTIKAHMKSILSKLEAKDRTHAVMIALRRGILDV